MKLFGMGFSWGGYESLILPVNLTTRRGAMRGEEGGPTLRIHAGLESVAELIADLEAGFARLAAARG
jgi:cystathionine beta-lyase